MAEKKGRINLWIFTLLNEADIHLDFLSHLRRRSITNMQKTASKKHFRKDIKKMAIGANKFRLRGCFFQGMVL